MATGDRRRFLAALLLTSLLLTSLAIVDVGGAGGQVDLQGFKRKSRAAAALAGAAVVEDVLELLDLVELVHLAENGEPIRRKLDPCLGPCTLRAYRGGELAQ